MPTFIAAADWSAFSSLIIRTCMSFFNFTALHCWCLLRAGFMISSRIHFMALCDIVTTCGYDLSCTEKLREWSNLCCQCCNFCPKVKPQAFHTAWMLQHLWLGLVIKGSLKGCVDLEYSQVTKEVEWKIKQCQNNSQYNTCQRARWTSSPIATSNKSHYITLFRFLVGWTDTL